jgi:CheY-like chemotaxis protein
VARRLVKKTGATVYTASNGEEGLEQVRQVPPHFIISDLSMPVMDGWIFIQMLNDNRATAQIPVIALTAHGMAGDRERAMQAGFVNYITKPLDPSKFLEQLLLILEAIPELALYR